MAHNCYKCNANEVSEEYHRCLDCEKAHQEFAKELDARPKTKVKKVKEELFPIKEIKGGIEVTTWIDRQDAANMGINLPPK